MGEAKNKEAALQAAQQATENAHSLRVTPPQLAIMLVFDAQAQALQMGANQLGGFLGEKEAAEVLLSAKQHIEKAGMRMRAQWERSIQVVAPADVPRLIQP